MTIGGRLSLLLALPILVLTGVGGLTLYQLHEIQQKAKFVGELQIESLAAVGDISRRLTQMRVGLRDSLLGENQNAAQERRLQIRRKAAAELDRITDALWRCAHYR